MKAFILYQLDRAERYVAISLLGFQLTISFFSLLFTEKELRSSETEEKKLIILVVQSGPLAIVCSAAVGIEVTYSDRFLFSFTTLALPYTKQIKAGDRYLKCIRTEEMEEEESKMDAVDP